MQQDNYNSRVSYTRPNTYTIEEARLSRLYFTVLRSKIEASGVSIYIIKLLHLINMMLSKCMYMYLEPMVINRYA